jgi:putative membrane protein
VNDETPIDGLDPRVQFAAERTLLSWVRTGLAMMGFGFVVARFGIIMRELASPERAPDEQGRFSLWAGVGLVLFGVAIAVGSAWQNHRTMRRLARGETLPVSSWSLSTIVAMLLALFGLLMAGYLILGVRQ